MTARALSIQQPWAWAITDLDKRVENRTRPTSFRGEVFLHASAKARPMDELDCCTDDEREHARLAFYGGAMALGSIVGVAEIVDCICAAGGTASLAGDRWLEGPWAYVLAYVRTLPEPVPCKGALGFWQVPDDVERAVRAQLKEIDMARKAKTAPPAGDAPANSREDIGYGKAAANGDDLSPDQRRQLVRLAREISAATKDVEAKASARGSASKALQEAQKGIKRLVAEQNAVVGGTWQAGMFDEEDADGEEGDD